MSSGQHQAAAAPRDERIERRLGAVAAHHLPAGHRVAVGVAQQSSSLGGHDLPLLGSGDLAKDVVDRGERVADLLTLFGALDQRRDLEQLEVARHGLVDVEVGVEPHFAEPPSHARHGVEQLVAEDAEHRVQALGRTEELLVEDLLLGVDRAAGLLVERRRTRRGAHGGALRPGEHEGATCPGDRHVQRPAHLGLVLHVPRGSGSDSFSSSSGTSWPRARQAPGVRRGQAGHEDVVELESLGGVHIVITWTAGVAAGRAASSSQAPDSATAQR